MNEKNRGNMGKKIAEKLEVIREVDKNERSNSEITQADGIPLSILSAYLENQRSLEQQATQGRDMSKCVRICATKHDNMEGRLFVWFWHT
jgi:hypothetical protein